MEKEEVTLLAQLLTGIKDAISELEKAEKEKDMEKMAEAKAEILNFHKQIDQLL